MRNAQALWVPYQKGKDNSIIKVQEKHKVSIVCGWEWKR